MREREGLRRKRIEAGLCCRCGKTRGKYGTTTMCRPCADEKTKQVMNSKTHRSRKVTEERECENCFTWFLPNDNRGQRIFCDACEPWFPDTWDEKREQEQARKVRVISANDILDGWQRQS